MASVSYVIEKQIGVLSTSSKGWQLEVNLISWNGAPAKIDIRDWAPDHAKAGKGITLSEEETVNLLLALGAEPQQAKQPEPEPQAKQPEPEPQPQANPSGFNAAQLAAIEAAKKLMGNSK